MNLPTNLGLHVAVVSVYFVCRCLEEDRPCVQISLASIITVLDCWTHPNFHKMSYTWLFSPRLR